MTNSRRSSVHHAGDGRQASIAIETAPPLAHVKTTVVHDAARAAQSETSMTLLQGVKTYPKAVAWSMFISTCIVMEGFDIVLINSLYGLPAFQRRFGEKQNDGSYQVSAAWQSGLSNGALVGEIIGLMAVGLIAEKFGFRKTLIGALIALIGFIFILFFAQNLPMLLVGEILMGIPWGAFQTLTTTYASEVCPVVLRPYLTTYVNMCWVIGQFLSSAVLKGVSNELGPIGYKLPYGLQWMWPVPLITGILLAPESPWWLVRQGRIEDAKVQLLRLSSRHQEDFDADATISMMIYTNELEKEHTATSRYIDCLKGVDLRRTEIVCGVWTIQTLCGASSFTGYSTYFFQQAGLSVSYSFSLSLGQYAIGAVGTVLSWFLMSRIGRRSLYFYGQVAMALLLIIVGFLGLSHSSSAPWGVGAMILIYTFIYDATVGPVCYSLVAEISSTRLRNKTVVLARNLYNITGIIANIFTTHMLNPEAWGWGAKTGFFWGAACALCAVWTFWRLPEPNGRTFAELDMLFAARVPARKFRTTDIATIGGDRGLNEPDAITKPSFVEKVERLTSEVAVSMRSLG